MYRIRIHVYYLGVIVLIIFSFIWYQLNTFQTKPSRNISLHLDVNVHRQDVESITLLQSSRQLPQRELLANDNITQSKTLALPKKLSSATSVIKISLPKESPFSPKTKQICQYVLKNSSKINLSKQQMDSTLICKEDSYYLSVNCSELLQYFFLDALPEEYDFPIAFSMRLMHYIFNKNTSMILVLCSFAY